MPVTVPAHQSVVLPLKLIWPRRVDATALCVGSAVPDLGYAFFGVDSHSPLGVAVFVVPATLAICAVLRWRAAAGIFANLPDLGPFRVHSYRVLVDRRPGRWVTLGSAVVGALSHVVLDAFTHAGRWGSDLAGFDRVVAELPGGADLTIARILQYSGHVVGSAVTIGVLWLIGRRRLLERWYGPDPVARARRFSLSGRDRGRFWATVLAAVALAATAAAAVGRSVIFSAMVGLTLGLLVAGSRPIPAGAPQAEGPRVASGRSGPSAGPPLR